MSQVVEKAAGMGALVVEGGVAFRVWAPNADKVAVVGSFNNWDETTHTLTSEMNGYWYGVAAEAKIGDEYRFIIWNGEQKLSRMDPYAREVTNSVGNSVVYNNGFDWEGDDYKLPPFNELVIYELHVGSFNDDPGGTPGELRDVIDRFDHLKKLGVNVLQLMPLAEFAGDFSWGYNPAHIFAVESAYGGPNALKKFVKAAHRAGFGVVLDVVYNHFGPSDLDLWQFDGWSENGGGGIYFYNDWKGETPWGHTRPDYGRGEVRQFIHDNAMMWLEDYHMDGLRFDMTLYIRSVRGNEGDPGDSLPDGWGLSQWINRDVRQRFPNCITIAEDLRNNEWLTKDDGAGGAGFHTQWDANFVHPVRAAVSVIEDGDRSMQAIAHALTCRYNGDAFQRVVYSESHDEVANGKSRVPSEINPDDPTGWYAQRRSTLAAGLVFTAPGIPMLFQGQEFLQGEWFRDDVPLDWDLNESYSGIVRMYRDLIRLRLNRTGNTRGLSGQGVYVHHVNDTDKVIGWQRWDQRGAGDDVIVVANFNSQPRENYLLGFPNAGTWRLRFNSDARSYSDVFGNHPSGDVEATSGSRDGMPSQGTLSIGPYSLLIYSQDRR
ncbi:MAG: alpha amylase C-terminal domain-containing protein [Planctomycetales bacterium]|nr:alpha amylase C-terminal domain-containing protein [Planctomycetales bacterium]